MTEHAQGWGGETGEREGISDFMGKLGRHYFLRKKKMHYQYYTTNNVTGILRYNMMV